MKQTLAWLGGVSAVAVVCVLVGGGGMQVTASVPQAGKDGVPVPSIPSPSAEATTQEALSPYVDVSHIESDCRHPLL